MQINETIVVNVICQKENFVKLYFVENKAIKMAVEITNKIFNIIDAMLSWTSCSLVCICLYFVCVIIVKIFLIYFGKIRLIIANNMTTPSSK